ncbi:tetratricopeptide repeat protein [Streptomyces sp. NPDC021224]|uniref:tetratricopeptide repeat protein n=1 Tax=unclassified Streptomyces TaxID=2593676 RepID=UPI00379DC954
MRDLALATALGPMAVAGVLATRRVLSAEESARSGDDGTGVLPVHAVADEAVPEPSGHRRVGETEPPSPGGGVRAGRDIHVENQGSGAAVGQAHIVNNYQVTQTAVRLPYRIGRVPALASPFQERDVPEPVGGRPLVLAGMFGTGKSQLAACYAESAWDSGDLHLLLWVDASSREAVLSAYARAGQDVLGRTYADAADGAQAFLNWLRPAGGTQPHPWLVVLDGVTDPAHLTGLWPPASPVGRVLVTSNRADFEGPGSPQVVRVRPFTFEEAHAYLELALELNPAARRAVGNDVRAFVARAAGEIESGGLALDTYLDAYLASRGAAPGRDEARPTPLQRSIDAAAAMAPDGVVRAVFATITQLDGERVPEDILVTEAALRHIALLGDRLRAAGAQWLGADAPAPAAQERSVPREAARIVPVEAAPALAALVERYISREAAAWIVPVDADAVRVALRALHATSLVDREETGGFRSVSTVPYARRASLAGVPSLYDEEPVRQGLLDAVAAAWPDVERSLLHAGSLWDTAEALGACDAEIDGRSVADLSRGDGLHPVAFRYGRSLGAWGRYGRAEEYFRDLVRLDSERLGTEHPDMLKGLARAARWRGARGDEFGAASELADVTARQRAVLGDEDPELLTTRCDLAAARLSAIGWDAPAPRAELAAVLADRIRLLGPDHIDTLHTASEIVAAMLGRETTEPLVPDVDAAAGLLLDGDDRRRFSETTLASALHARLLRTVGADHPFAIVAMRLHASACARGGDHAQAQALVARAFTDARRALGPDHPATLECRIAVAVAGATGSGRRVFERTLRDMHDRWEERERGHPWTVIIRGRLLRFASPDPEPAAFAETSAELLADTERVFGACHRRTRQLLADVAETHERAGRPVAALVALADLAARCARVPGPEHPGTLRVRLRLASARGSQADTLGALTALVELHVDCVRVLGPEHPVTLDTRHQLALNRYVAGDTPGALSDLARLLAVRERLDGSGAASTREVRDDLERMRADEEE